ncbi:hypothetical protein [Paraburkholderia sp. BCC1884]|nr:hypothetical protein [Paraburkholderia sp. BCC1884]
MSNSSSGSESTFGKRMMWFVLLWLVGFGGTVLLALPFHLMVAAAMRH